jgi:hypothetical protein
MRQGLPHRVATWPRKWIASQVDLSGFASQLGLAGSRGFSIGKTAPLCSLRQRRMPDRRV